MKIALVHYWLTGMRGGEKVLEALAEIYPEADIFTLVVDRNNISEKLKSHRITSSFLQKIGGVKHYQKMLPLMPFALEAFDVTSYDLVISSEAGPAKGIVVRPDALHICYCHSPMRYIWDLYPQYRGKAGFLEKALMSVVAPAMRMWDVTTASRVDYFISNSRYVSKRINKFYRRDSTVINPPVAVERFSAAEKVSDFYLCAGQITPYKKIDLAIDAFNRMGKRLVIVGGGATDALKKTAGPTISFVGSADDQAMAKYFSECQALIYPGVEDFGILPLEVMASGRPVIAFGQGGAAETVLPGITGVLFSHQTADGLIEAVRLFEEKGVSGSPEQFRTHAEQYSVEAFKRNIKEFVETKLSLNSGTGL